MEPLRDEDPKEIGGFALVCRIGAGGMGQVFLGESAAGHQAAVKVIKPSVLDEDTRARFLSEVDSLRTVYGPFVAAFVGADADADQPWLAVEYVPGPDLRTFVTEHGPLPLAETASLGALLAEGLGTVHDAGLLHRDLKPQNILLSRYGPKVIDFGLAVLAERRTTLTATGFVVGSVLCMPPEQARGEHQLDRSADVYALGAVLLFAATGHYPYEGPTWQAVALKIEDPATPPDLTNLPPELGPLVTDMLAPDPGARPALPEVIKRLVRAIHDQGLTALQAKYRLTDLTPEIVVPQLPAPPPGPHRGPTPPPTRPPPSTRRRWRTTSRRSRRYRPGRGSPPTSTTNPAGNPGALAPPSPGRPSSGRTGARPEAVGALASDSRPPSRSLSGSAQGTRGRRASEPRRFASPMPVRALPPP
ncbi:serine/threonine-protein kinase [Streptomyces phaeoluteigriseus]|uniref:serine/threonine-protein kinase n=1 Tax=Streptomyces phaeoluteigriseus TaxID=114686 RepID=UPI000B219FB2|nr:serine/threonine-protein kinase [Streptomyces phaeoluteigriseus]